MKRRIVICLLALLMACGPWQGAPGFGMTAAHAEGHEGGGGGGGGGEGGKKEGDPNVKHPDFEYIDLNPLILPIITDKGLTQQLNLMVSLELPYGNKEEIKPMAPRLADAYLQDLYGALGAGGAMMRGNVVDVVAIKQRLSAVTLKVMGPEKVHDVLLQVVQQRPM